MQRWEARPSAACIHGALLVLLCASALVGCGSARARDEAPTGGTVVWEGSKDQWVRLEPRDDAGSPPNDHPVQLSAAEVSGALASLRVVEDEEDTAEPEPIFTPQEASVLGEAVARGLAQAAPDQDVTFRSVGSRKLTSGRVVKVARANSGRVFEQAGKLNLILGDVRARVQTKTVYGQWDEDFSKPRPAARSSNAERDWKVVVPAGVGQQDGRDDWLVFDEAQLAALSAPAPAAAPAAAAAAPASTTAPPSAAAPPPPAAPSAPAVQNAPAASPASSPEADMERRLRTLKDLHDKGLITEEAYRAKVEEILSVL